MTKSTGSPNLSGLLGGLFETIENVSHLVADVIEDKVGGGEENEKRGTAEPTANYKAVFNLGLSDALILEDGSWQVVAIEEDAFDSDLVAVALENGETYNLLRTSLVWVV